MNVDPMALTELELAMRKLANRVKLDTIEACANIADAIDSGRGNEKQIAKSIRALAVTSTHQPGEEA